MRSRRANPMVNTVVPAACLYLCSASNRYISSQGLRPLRDGVVKALRKHADTYDSSAQMVSDNASSQRGAQSVAAYSVEPVSVDSLRAVTNERAIVRPHQRAEMPVRPPRDGRKDGGGGTRGAEPARKRQSVNMKRGPRRGSTRGGAGGGGGGGGGCGGGI